MSGMPNPFRRDRPVRKPPPAGLGHKEMFRLYIMLAVLLFIVAVMLGLFLMSSRKKSEGPPQPPLGENEVRYRIREKPEEARPVPEAPKQGAEAPEPQPAPEKTEPEKPEEKQTQKETAKDDLQAALDEFRVETEEQLRERPVKESPGFMTLLNHFLQKLTPEEATAKVDPKLTAANLFREPDRHRGQFVRLQGRLIDIFTERLQATTPTGTDVVYWGFMEVRDPSHPACTICFYLPDKAVDPKTGEEIVWNTKKHKGYTFITDNVMVEGMFLRLYQYEGSSPDDPSKPWVTAGVLFVKNIVRVVPPEPVDPTPFILVVAGLATVLIVAVLIGGFMSRKYGRGSIHLRMHEARKKKGKSTLPAPKGSALGDEVSKPPE